MIPALLMFCLVLVSAASCMGQETEFQKFVSQEGRFHVEMPGVPEEKVEDWGNGIVGSEFSARSGLTRYVVIYADLDEETAKKHTAQELITVFRSGYRENKTIEDDQEIKLGKRDIPGREYRLEASDGVFVRERMYMDGRRLYITFLATLGNKDPLDSEEAKKFFDSFTIQP